MFPPPVRPLPDPAIRPARPASHRRRPGPLGPVLLVTAFLALAATLAAGRPAVANGPDAATGKTNGEAIVLVDDRQTTHRFAKPPMRIVSLLPSLTEAVWALGGGERLVGVDRYSNWPDALAGLPHLGGLDDALIEAIARLRPEVVLASVSARSLDRLESLGFVVVRLRSESHADVQRTLTKLARLLGRPEAADALWQAIQARLADARARVPASVRGRSAYFEIGGGPYAAGTRSFIGETMAQLGLVNIAPAELGPFPKLNPEFVVRARPWVAIGLDRDMATLGERPGWSVIPAVREQRLCSLTHPDYEMVIRPGPRLGEAAGLLAACLAGMGR